jgi:hypothetical protein
MKIENWPRQWESAVDGPAPTIWFGSSAVDGDALPFKSVPVGSMYVQTGDTPVLWRKVTDTAGGHDTDWAGGMNVIAQRVALADFTDGGGAAGTLDLDGEIPAGAFVLRTVVENVTGFAGDTSAALTVGDGTDADRYNATTIDVFSDVVALDGGAPSGTQVHVTAKTPRLTVTSGADWGSVSAGAMTVNIYYLK